MSSRLGVSACKSRFHEFKQILRPEGFIYQPMEEIVEFSDHVTFMHPLKVFGSREQNDECT